METYLRAAVLARATGMKDHLGSNLKRCFGASIFLPAAFCRSSATPSLLQLQCSMDASMSLSFEASPPPNAPGTEHHSSAPPPPHDRNESTIPRVCSPAPLSVSVTSSIFARLSKREHAPVRNGDGPAGGIPYARHPSQSRSPVVQPPVDDRFCVSDNENTVFCLKRFCS